MYGMRHRRRNPPALPSPGTPHDRPPVVRQFGGQRRRHPVRRSGVPAAFWLAIFLTLGLAACQSATTGPARTGGTTAGGGSVSQTLVGRWRRTVVLQTPTDITTSETTWLFAPEGSCERSVATTTVSAGYTDTVRSPCTWSVAGSTVTVNYTGAGTAQFSWSLHGATLYLSGVPFARA